jgi:hypothetical protein
VDVLVVAEAPMSAIRDSGDVRSSVHASFWMYPRGLPNEYRDSVAVRASGVERWIYRIPVAQYFYRIEATADGSMIAGRAMGWFAAGADTSSAFGTRGFGMSDMVLATSAQSSRSAPSSWRDFTIAPVVGAAPARSTIHLIWENYELGARDGTSEYTIAVTIQRRRSAAGRIAATVVGVVEGAVGIDRRDDRVTSRWARKRAAAATLVDEVAFDLADTPAGEYTITVDITDRVSGRMTSTSASLVIR